MQFIVHEVQGELDASVAPTAQQEFQSGLQAYFGVASSAFQVDQANPVCEFRLE